MVEAASALKTFTLVPAVGEPTSAPGPLSWVPPAHIPIGVGVCLRRCRFSPAGGRQGAPRTRSLYPSPPQWCPERMGRAAHPPRAPPDPILRPAGLNVYSLLKHQTLVLTLPALALLEQKLLWHGSRYTPLYPFRLPYRDFPCGPTAPPPA